MADWASDLGHWVLGSEPSRERKGHQDMVLARLEMDMELGTALGRVNFDRPPGFGPLPLRGSGPGEAP
jgi:hypothetical protein